MSRRYVNQLGGGETVEQVFLASEKQLRTNRNGNLYLQVRLSDRTGSLTAMLWNANENLYRAFENGDYVKAAGTTQFYNGGLQMIATRFDRTDPAQIDEAEFVTLGAQQIDRLMQQLSQRLRAVESPALRDLAECFLLDDELMAKFQTAAAGIKLHHAYHGGLLEHVVHMMELCDAVTPLYPGVDADLVLFGVFLHDIGKIDELMCDRDLGYTDEGQLLGHLVLGVSLLETKIRELEGHTRETFPAKLALRLKHMIVSHNGSLEFGSPKVPMTLEAIVLHYLDTMDAKLHGYAQMIRDDANTDSDWTPYHAASGRKLYKPSLTTQGATAVSAADAADREHSPKSETT